MSGKLPPPVAACRFTEQGDGVVARTACFNESHPLRIVGESYSFYVIEKIIQAHDSRSLGVSLARHGGAQQIMQCGALIVVHITDEQSVRVHHADRQIGPGRTLVNMQRHYCGLTLAVVECRNE